MEMISQTVKALVALAAKLEPHRNEKPIINDMFEAADDWKNFGQLLVERSDQHDLSGRMAQEEELLARLPIFYGDALSQNPDYTKILELGASLVAACKQRKLHPDGYLGMLKILRQTFAFLTTEFGLRPGAGSSGACEYSSDRVSVSLSLPSHYNSSCWVKQMSDPTCGFMLEYILFMVGKPISLALPSDKEITTEADVQAWFTTVADILRQHGADVLADKPGAFERLAQATAERDRLIGEENERLYGAGSSITSSGG